jgi:hypothetical protein
MDKQDARKLAPAAQYEMRKQVIRAYGRGRNRVQISAEIGLSYPERSRYSDTLENNQVH